MFDQHGRTRNAASGLRWCRDRPGAALLHEGEEIGHLPMLDDQGGQSRHPRYFILELAERQLTPRRLAPIIRRIERLTWHPA
jgi:hypothetical protein